MLLYVVDNIRLKFVPILSPCGNDVEILTFQVRKIVVENFDLLGTKMDIGTSKKYVYIWLKHNNLILP